MDKLRVKPLVWEDCQPDDLFGITSRADCVFPGDFSTYVIYDESACDDGVLEDGKSFWFEGGTQFATLDEAKAAAQADYEARILAALEPVTVRDEDKLIGAIWAHYGDLKSAKAALRALAQKDAFAGRQSGEGQVRASVTAQRPRWP